MIFEPHTNKLSINSWKKRTCEFTCGFLYFGHISKNDPYTYTVNDENERVFLNFSEMCPPLPIIINKMGMNIGNWLIQSFWLHIHHYLSSAEWSTCLEFSYLWSHHISVVNSMCTCHDSSLHAKITHVLIGSLSAWDWYGGLEIYAKSDTLPPNEAQGFDFAGPVCCHAVRLSIQMALVTILVSVIASQDYTRFLIASISVRDKYSGYKSTKFFR